MRVLDLFCGQGGAGAGYARAGMEVVGVDIKRQPRYPFEFVQADWREFLEQADLEQFDLIHASPPCQSYSRMKGLANPQPSLIWPVRRCLRDSGLPFVIENVTGAPLLHPVALCGEMFGLRTYRHRLFEANFPLPRPAHLPHRAPVAEMGRPVRDGEYMHVIGNFIGADLGRQIMEMPWASREGLSEAIPPAYTEWIGRRFIEWTEWSFRAAA